MNFLWSTVFERVWEQPPPATDADIAFLLESLSGPLSDEEARKNFEQQRNPWLANQPEHAAWRPKWATGWEFPPSILPRSYLDLLRWSNGPGTVNGAREIDFFSTADLREMMVGYEVPRNIPRAIPFASNGGGEWLLFDTREGLVGGEYPILFASASGGLMHDEVQRIAASLEELCRSTLELSPAEDDVMPEPEYIDVVLAREPAGGLGELSRALRELKLTVPTSALRSYLLGLPKPILEQVPFYPFSIIVEKLNATSPFLEIVEHVAKRSKR